MRLKPFRLTRRYVAAKYFGQATVILGLGRADPHRERGRLASILFAAAARDPEKKMRGYFQLQIMPHPAVLLLR